MKEHIVTKDYFKSKEVFKLLKNNDLDMLCTNPVPDNLSTYYDSEDYISHTDKKQGLFSWLYQKVKEFSLNRKVSLINRFKSANNRILDIGAGTGDFLLKAKNSGWQIKGVEPNATAFKHAANKGLELECSLENVSNEYFDVVTLWHVLEHLPNLEAQIDGLSKLVNPGGGLVIAVPNYNSYDAKYYKEYWAAYDTPRHLWHFSKSSIIKLFEPKGFEVVEIKPMYFDSFYVSMLSEKYKGNRFIWLRGGIIGLLSNIKALFSGEYSSLIYVLRKK